MVPSAADALAKAGEEREGWRIRAIRPESPETVARLHSMGLQVAMLTGDSRAVAAEVAEELGIDEAGAWRWSETG